MSVAILEKETMDTLADMQAGLKNYEINYQADLTTMFKCGSCAGKCKGSCMGRAKLGHRT